MTLRRLHLAILPQQVVILLEGQPERLDDFHMVDLDGAVLAVFLDARGEAHAGAQVGKLAAHLRIHARRLVEHLQQPRDGFHLLVVLPLTQLVGQSVALANCGGRRGHTGSFASAADFGLGSLVVVPLLKGELLFLFDVGDHAQGVGEGLRSARQAEEMPLQKVIPVDSPVEKTHNLPVEPETGKDGIVTHNTEVWALVAIRTLLRDVVSPSRIVMRDQKSYCSILLDDNNRKPICRLFNFDHFDWGMDNIGKNAYILILTESNEKGERHNLQYVDDIYPLTEPLVKAVMRHEKGKESTE